MKTRTTKRLNIRAVPIELALRIKVVAAMQQLSIEELAIRLLADGMKQLDAQNGKPK